MNATLDVKALCLGVLTHGEASGYDIKKYFEETFSHFYLAGYGSIYPALAELLAEGAVTVRAVPQAGRPDRKVYQLTDAGRQRFLATLAATPPSHKVRSEFLVLMHFAALLPPERLLAVLDERVDEFDRTLGQLEECERENPGAHFCAGFGRTVLRAARDYVAAYRGRLAAGPRPAPANDVVSPAVASEPPRRKTGS